jgi:predicted RNA-binding Zn ribbon-like protein
MTERVGGHPVLEFVNTLYSWTAPNARDELASFADASAFAVETGLIDTAEAAALADPDDRELAKLRELRRLFHRALPARSPKPDDLDALARAWSAAARHGRLRPASRGRVDLVFAAAGPALVRHRLVQSAVELLTSDARSRVKSCPACGWLFLDATKNASRRWCSMQTCGSAAKAAAYYRRKKKLRPQAMYAIRPR